MRRPTLPLRMRLTLVFSVGMAIVLVGLGTFVYLRVSDDLIASVDLGLRSRAQILASAVTAAAQANVVQSEGSLIDPDEAFAQVLASDGSIVDASSAVTGGALLGPPEATSLSQPAFFTRLIPGVDDPVRLIAVPIQEGAVRRIAVVGTNLGDTNDALSDLLRVMIVAGPVALLITVAAGWLLAGAALRPVERMRTQAAAITAMDPARRLEVPDTADELARLGTTLNAMLDRLQESLERERRFVDDASHELRTPLGTMLAEIDVTLARERTEGELAGALGRVRQDVVRLQRLSEDLLILARARGGRIPVRRTHARLSTLVASSVQDVASQAAAAGVRIEPRVSDAEVSVDPDRIGQALRNLLDNALRHTPPGGEVALAALRANGRATFTVTDSGQGFTSDVLPRAFAPFSHGVNDAGEVDGTGLGLAIVKAVAEAHGGSAVAENTASGARVTMEIRAE